MSFYGDKILPYLVHSGRAELVIGLDPSAKLLSMAERAIRAVPVAVELLKCSAEAIPLEDKSIETVVTTWTLCTIPDVKRARGVAPCPQTHWPLALRRTWQFA